MEENNRILVLALARSGYHAVVHWMCVHLPGKVTFLNNCNHELAFRNRNVYKNAGNGRHMVYSFENFDLEGFEPLRVGEHFGKIVFVMRDPFNWLASSLMKKGKLNKPEKPFTPSQNKVRYPPYFGATKSRIAMYKQYIDQIYGLYDYLGGRDFHIIRYNDWFADHQYRSAIAQDIGFVNQDFGLDYVSPRGSGSSFDGRKYRGRGSQMDVLSRWKVFADDERFCRLMDRELVEIAEEYFPNIYQEVKSYGKKIR